METRMLEVKMAVAAFLTAIGTILGWKGIMAVVWVVVMALDYLSGTMAARKNKEWNSERAREGLSHKGGMILVGLVAGITDGILAVISAVIPHLQVAWPGVVLPLVLAWYILTELGSILENAVELGAAVPGWLTRGLKISLKSVEQLGNDSVHEDGDEPIE